MDRRRVTRKLREIGGIINSTDLNYNFRVMQEDLQGAIQGLIFTPRSIADIMADRDLIPESELAPGFWVAVSETGIVYEYNMDNDVLKNGPTRYFGPMDGDLPSVPYVINGDPTSGEWLKGWYTMRSNKVNDYAFTSATMGGLVFKHGDWAVWHEENGVYKWRRVPKWVEIMNVTSILEQGIIGRLEGLHTEDKTTIVNAINEIHDDLGTLNNLTTFDKTTAVAAINELDREVGDLNNLHTEHKTTIVGSINEVHDDLGTLDNLTTAQKGTAVAAINELDAEMGNLSSLKTEHKATMVGAVNEVHDDLGTLTDLTTANKNTAVAAINELDKDIGNLAGLNTTTKANTVSAINEVLKDLGPITSLTTLARENAVVAINELKSEVDALQGAFIYIGRIYEDTVNITDTMLRARAAEIMGTSDLKTGWTLVDNEQHEWYYNGILDEWIDFEQPNIYPAQNDQLGTVRGSALGDISIVDGNMTVLEARNADRLNNKSPDFYASKEYADTKANKIDVLELQNTTAYEPTEPYHPATKDYVDMMSVGGVWGEIEGNIEKQIDLVNYVNQRALKTNVLEKNGTSSYIPTAPYHPATKDYVDTVLANHKNWGQIAGDIADQDDLQDALLAKQDVATAWNQDNLVVGTEQPAIPLQGFKIWIDMNS